ncbi:hypothetical protein CHS0354_014358 [Potamilus streckersoni]|uniref:Uncharacterized protein n=1 Tax=Potamilus streckersoni TaxID=2493646 RepID=A0AAE0SLV3_9BIVA|nr:hypothetical protein CHS0354_014358 [Potamilus streckersoni]
MSGRGKGGRGMACIAPDKQPQGPQSIPSSLGVGSGRLWGLAFLGRWLGFLFCADILAWSSLVFDIVYSQPMGL